MDNECDTSVLYIIVDPLDGSMIHEAYDLVALANPSVGTVSSSSSSSSTGDDEDTVANEIDAGIGDGDGGASSSTADAYMVEEVNL